MEGGACTVGTGQGAGEVVPCATSVGAISMNTEFCKNLGEQGFREEAFITQESRPFGCPIAFHVEMNPNVQGYSLRSQIPKATRET